MPTDKSVMLTEPPIISEEKNMRVAIGVIIENKKKILLTYRSIELPQGGFWELPGGKINKLETGVQALKRELYEELKIKIQTLANITQVYYFYDDILVTLDAWLVVKYAGVPRSAEGQKISWVNLADLDITSLTRPNLAIIKAVMNQNMISNIEK